MKIRKTPAPWIHKTSLDLIINKTKKLLKKILSDQIFQKLKLKFFLLYKTENIMLFYWIKHPSDTCRQLSFRTSSLYTKTTGLFYTKKATEGCWISDKNCKKRGLYFLNFGHTYLYVCLSICYVNWCILFLRLWECSSLRRAIAKFLTH